MKLHSLNLASGSTTAGVRRGLGHVIVFEVLNAFSISRMDEATLFKFGKSHPKGKKFSTKKAWSGSGDRFYRATRTHSADYAVARCLSVRLSVRPSHAGIVCKWLYISSKFFHHRVAKPFYFFHTKRDGTVPTGTPITRDAECKKGMKKSRGFISELMQDG